MAKKLELNSMTEEDLITILCIQKKAEQDNIILEKVNKELQVDSKYHLDKKKINKFQKSINIEFKKKHFLSYRKEFKKVSIILLFVLPAFLISCMNSEAIRNHIFNTFAEINEKFTKIELEDEYSITGFYMPKYIPEGYKIDSIVSENFSKTIIFKNSNNSSITFNQYDENNSLNIDTENALVRATKVNKLDGLLIEKNGYLNLTWTDKIKGKIFIIASDSVKEEEIIKLAESINVSPE